jgi:hypothetical protein
MLSNNLNSFFSSLRTLFASTRTYVRALLRLLSSLSLHFVTASSPLLDRLSWWSFRWLRLLRFPSLRSYFSPLGRFRCDSAGAPLPHWRRGNQAALPTASTALRSGVVNTATLLPSLQSSTMLRCTCFRKNILK